MNSWLNSPLGIFLGKSYLKWRIVVCHVIQQFMFPNTYRVFLFKKHKGTLVLYYALVGICHKIATTRGICYGNWKTLVSSIAHSALAKKEEREEKEGGRKKIWLSCLCYY